MDNINPNFQTIGELFYKTVERVPNNQFLGYHKSNEPYKWVTYKEAFQKIVNIGSGIYYLNYKKNDKIGIFSPNRIEWLLIDLACNCYSMISVALYSTLGLNSINYIINHSEIRIIFCDIKSIHKLLSINNLSNNIKTIVCFDNIETKIKINEIEILTLQDLENIGSKNILSMKIPLQEDISTIIYTSGSTGNPKGVLITNKNLVFSLIQLSKADHGFNGELETHFSYLPLAHCFDKVCCYFTIMFNSRIGFYQGNINELFNDIIELKPTFLLGVPKIWKKIQDFVNFTGNKNLINWKLKFILSGSAPLDEKLSNFLKEFFKCPVMQGYALTETCSVGTISDRSNDKSGHVGVPLCYVNMKLVDVPELNYYSTDKPNPRGEIWISGPNVFKGYYKDPEQTNESLTEDGWFKTGDIGKLNTDGTFSIIDRKKSMFKLSIGEYIAPEYLESIYLRSSLINQIFVTGNSYNNFIVAIVVPNFDVIISIAKKMNISTQDYKLLCQNDNIYSIIFQSLKKVAEEEKLNSFEIIKCIYIECNPFTEENGFLTPTQKLKRYNLNQYYENIINILIEKHKKYFSQ